MAEIMELYWKLEKELKENNPELLDAFGGPGNLQVGDDFSLLVWTDKIHYTEVQHDQLMAVWDQLLKAEGL